MPKLTKYSRERIADRAVAHAFDPRQNTEAEAEDALAREAYATLFSKTELKAAEALPANWLRKDKCLRFNVGSQDITLKVLDEGLLVPYRPKDSESGGYYCHRLGVIPHGELADRIQAHAREVDNTKNDRNAAYRSIAAMLDAVTTTGKLKEVWPEGAQFYADFEDRPTPSLPAVRVDEINALLGLSAAA